MLVYKTEFSTDGVTQCQKTTVTVTHGNNYTGTWTPMMRVIIIIQWCMVHGAPFPGFCRFPRFAAVFAETVLDRYLFDSLQTKLRLFRNHPKSSFLGSFYDLEATISRLPRISGVFFLTSNFGKFQGAGVSKKKYKTSQNDTNFMKLQKLCKTIK